jgi:general secretion pathway protein D
MKTHRTSILYAICCAVVIFAAFASADDTTDIAESRGALNPDSIGETKRISMRFKDASLDHVLEFLSDVTGYTIVKDADLNVRVSIISPHDLPVDEAFSVLDSILAIKGYTSIVNGKTVKIVPLAEVKLEATPIQVGSDPEVIKSQDTIVTQVMPLASADATQLVKDLKDFVPQYGVMTAYGRSNTLIITAASANIKRLAQIVKQLDISMADLIKIEVFSLQYADATKLADVITKLYEKPRDAQVAAEQERQQRGRFRGGFGGRGFGRGGDGGGDDGATPPESSPTNGGVLQRIGEVKAVADENTNSLIVSASEHNLSVLRALIAQLDKRLFSEPETRVFTLKFGDATEIANELNQAFSSSARNVFTGGGFGGRGGRFFQQQQQQQRGRTGEGGEGVLGLPELTAVPDIRTNSVMVTTTAQQIEGISQLIEQLDRDIADFAEDTRVFTLEHADAANVASVLNDLLDTELFERQAATRTNFGGGSGGGFGGGGFATRRSSGALGSSAQTADTARGLTGNVKIVADEETNALLITTFVRNFPAVEKLIVALDVLLPQVLIEAQIIEVTLDDESAFGVEWMWEQETTANDKTYNQSGTTDFGLSEEIFGLKYGIVSGKLDTMLHALTKDTKVNILSTPRIMTKNNQEAIINVGQEVPFRVSTQETLTGGILTSTDFRDVGVILTVTPRINRSGTVSLDMNQQINTLIEFTLFDAPIISTREASASVTVKDRQTMVIGGMIKDDKTETVHKIPILGDIPLLGKLFRRKDTRIEKTELMVFITPHVVYTDDDASRVTEEQKSKLHMQNGSVGK